MATRTTTIRLPTDVRDRLDRHLARSRLSLNQLVAAAVTEYLDRHDRRRKDCSLLQGDDIDVALMAEILHKEGRAE